MLCEVCLEVASGPKMDFGFQPLADDLVKIGDTGESLRFQQSVILCCNCFTVLQTHQVPKEVLFSSNYHYRASLTKDVIQGMSELVTHVLRYKNDVSRRYTILDVGCNDGTLLNLFKERIDCVTVGVDPTDAILEATSNVNFTYKQFFTLKSASEIRLKHGFPDVITFTNVFAHIEDFEALLGALSELIGSETTLVIENHYLGSIIESKQFDSFYHEHPRTYSLRSFVVIADKLGLNINHVAFPSRYGGNIRVTMSKEPKVFEGLTELLNSELAIPEKFEQLQSHYMLWMENSKQAVQELSSKGKFIGKSLPARAVMLITSLGITEKEMPFVFEKPGSPKIGSYVPGTRIEIRSDDELKDFNCYPIVLWAWHIGPEITSYLIANNYMGDVFMPMPVFKKVN